MKRPTPQKRYVTYDLLLIPDNNRRMKKVRISDKHIQWLIGGALTGLLFLIFNIIGFWHYRSLYASLEGERQKVIAFEKDKVELASKVEILEKTLTETEQMTGKLASLVGPERLPLQKGVGPIPSQAFDVQARTASVDLTTLQPHVDDMQDRAMNLQSKIKELKKIQEDKLIYMASTPSLWPVKGWVTSDFGARRSPFSLAPDFHEGVDIAAQWGTPVISSADGVVTFAGYRGGLGKSIIIDHGFGIKTYYGHNSEILVTEGQKITRGTKIALVGSTGHSTGPHLHYEVHLDGVPVDPMKYVP